MLNRFKISNTQKNNCTVIASVLNSNESLFLEKIVLLFVSLKALLKNWKIEIRKITMMWSLSLVNLTKDYLRNKLFQTSAFFHFKQISFSTSR